LRYGIRAFAGKWGAADSPPNRLDQPARSTSVHKPAVLRYLIILWYLLVSY
jgi:hypothetical protein